MADRVQSIKIIRSRPWLATQSGLRLEFRSPRCICFNKRAPPALVWNQSFPSPRWICLKRLCELHLPRFGIRVFLLLGTVGPRHLLSGATLLCHFSRASHDPPPMDAGGCRSAPAGQLTATKPTTTDRVLTGNPLIGHIKGRACVSACIGSKEGTENLALQKITSITTPRNFWPPTDIPYSRSLMIMYMPYGFAQY